MSILATLPAPGWRYGRVSKKDGRITEATLTAVIAFMLTGDSDNPQGVSVIPVTTTGAVPQDEDHEYVLVAPDGSVDENGIPYADIAEFNRWGQAA